MYEEIGYDLDENHTYEDTGLGGLWDSIKSAGRKALHYGQKALDYVRGDNFSLPGEIDLYYLPVYDSDEHVIVVYEDVVQDYLANESFIQKVGKYLTRPFQDHSEQIFKAYNAVETMNLHYADHLSEENVKNEYIRNLCDEKVHHKTMAAFDTAVGSIIVWSPISISFLVFMRAGDHASAISGIKHAENITEYSENSVLSELESIIDSAPSQEEAYASAAEFLHNNDLDELATLYKTATINEFIPTKHRFSSYISSWFGKRDETIKSYYDDAVEVETTTKN